MKDISKLRGHVEEQFSNQETLNTLISTTFKGLTPEVAKRAALEGAMCGFTFEDFLDKNVYAIPFKGSYSLVTSISHARKIGMKSGVVGKSAPVFEEKDNKIISCTVTIKRKVKDYIGEYVATVFFAEFNTGRGLWTTKPRTMIAKVAEMHALRMACPEEMSDVYLQEEFSKEATVVVDVSKYDKKLNDTKSLDELRKVWGSLPVTAKKELEGLKGELKNKLSRK